MKIEHCIYKYVLIRNLGLDSEVVVLRTSNRRIIIAVAVAVAVAVVVVVVAVAVTVAAVVVVAVVNGIYYYNSTYLTYKYSVVQQ